MLPSYREGTHLNRNGYSNTTTKDTPTILIIAGNLLYQIQIRLVLESKGFAVRFAQTPAQAADFCRQHPGTIDLVLLETRFFDMSGIHLKERLNQVDPAIRCCLIQGDEAIKADSKRAENQGFDVFDKTLSFSELSSRLCDLITSPVNC
jgi:DNA-binding NtrC family response regulator